MPKFTDETFEENSFDSQISKKSHFAVLQYYYNIATSVVWLLYKTQQKALIQE